jgi:multidrug efflux pump subunit AcrB
VNFSAPFIRRPIGTTLMAVGLFLVGAVAYAFLPVASLPSVEFPTINVTASRPGADPNIMAATVAAPIERRLGEISGVTELTSVTSLGQSRITIQFDLSRSIEGAARDVQAALNAALSDLPTDLPTLPTFRKANFAAAPILILALTSKTMHPSAIYDAADSIIAQRLSQVSGVADVTVAGSEQPAVRVRVDPTRLSAMGLSMEDVRTAISKCRRSIGHLRWRQAGRDHRHQRSTVEFQRIRSAGREHRERHGDPPVEHCEHPPERAQQPGRRLVQPRSFSPAHYYQAGRCERHRHGRSHLLTAAGASAVGAGRAGNLGFE